MPAAWRRTCQHPGGYGLPLHIDRLAADHLQLRAGPCVGCSNYACRRAALPPVQVYPYPRINRETPTFTLGGFIEMSSYSSLLGTRSGGGSIAFWNVGPIADRFVYAHVHCRSAGPLMHAVLRSMMEAQQGKIRVGLAAVSWNGPIVGTACALQVCVRNGSALQRRVWL